MELKMKLRNETKSCYRFERLSDQGDCSFAHKLRKPCT